MGIDESETEDRVEERVEDIDDRLDHIPSSCSMPDLEDMTIGAAKEFRLGVVFLDISGFTQYESNNDYKDILFMLNLFIPEVMEIARNNDGIFEKNTGDGIMVYFGAGYSDGEIAHTVLEYLADVKLVLANYVNPYLEEYGVEPITIKAGAGLGTIYISRIGVHSLNRRTAVGTTPNLASKLEDKADSHEYFVNQGVYEGATEAECNWAEYLKDEGQFQNYRWGSESSGWKDSHYYNFTGGWASTEWENLK